MHGVLKMVNFKRAFLKILIAGYENFRIINSKEKKISEYYHERCKV